MSVASQTAMETGELELSSITPIIDNKQINAITANMDNRDNLHRSLSLENTSTLSRSESLMELKVTSPLTVSNHIIYRFQFVNYLKQNSKCKTINILFKYIENSYKFYDRSSENYSNHQECSRTIWVGFADGYLGSIWGWKVLTAQYFGWFQVSPM